MQVPLACRRPLLCSPTAKGRCNPQRSPCTGRPCTSRPLPQTTVMASTRGQHCCSSFAGFFLSTSVRLTMAAEQAASMFGPLILTAWSVILWVKAASPLGRCVCHEDHLTPGFSDFWQTFSICAGCPEALAGYLWQRQCTAREATCSQGNACGAPCDRDRVSIFEQTLVLMHHLAMMPRQDHTKVLQRQCGLPQRHQV